MNEVNVITANDLGAAFLKIARGTRPEDVTVLPTYLALDPYVRLTEPPSNPLEAIHLTVDASPCGITGTFAFGQLAMEHNGRSVNGKVNKLTDEMVRYAQVAALFVVAAQATEARITLPAIGVETLLPLLDYREVEQRRGFAAQFKGFYRGRFVGSSNPRWAALGDIMFRVERSLVGCEGAPVVAVTPAPVPGARFRAMVDIGESTLDAPVFERTEPGDYELKSHMSSGYEIGLGAAMEALRVDVNRTYRRNYSRADVARLLVENAGDIPNGTAQPISIMPLADRHLRPVAEEVADHLVSVWTRCPDLQAVELIGGGAPVLRPWLADSVEQTMTRQRQAGRFGLHEVPNPRTANATGAYAQAKRVFGNGNG